MAQATDYNKIDHEKTERNSPLSLKVEIQNKAPTYSWGAIIQSSFAIFKIMLYVKQTNVTLLHSGRLCNFDTPQV